MGSHFFASWSSLAPCVYQEEGHTFCPMTYCKV
uniref:Uncharacterized protein n=1 Tax=Anguilla anguilla TaxID=7936 RepID=A0A0E9R3J8_ANGAN